MRRFNPEKELYKIQHGNRNKIIFGVMALLLIIAIGSSYALYQVRYSKRIIYTKVADFSRDVNIFAVFIDNTKVDDFPTKTQGKIYDKIVCDNNTDNHVKAYWDYEKWGLVVETTKKAKCNVYFKTSTDTSGANPPELYQGLIPVTIDSNGTVKVADTSKEWYNYDKKQWANAVLVDSSKYATYNNKPNTTIPMTDILQMYVWIPRYKYELFNANFESVEEQMINIKFETNKETTGRTKCEIASNGKETCVYDDNGEWFTHPAFTFGNTELTGIWVGKFEPSHTTKSKGSGETDTTSVLNCTTTNCSESDYIRIIPNVPSLRYNNISNFFYVSRSIEKTTNKYNLNSNEIDTHMMKNMEWGAVAYLSQSKYGVCTNGECVRISNSYNEEYITGYANKTDQWNTTNGIKASTTGTIYGIYDMAGNSLEYVMSNMVDNAGNFSPILSGFTNPPAEKYYDKFEYGTSDTEYERMHLGDSSRETLKDLNSNTGQWYNEHFYTSFSEYACRIRSGHFADTINAGIFSQGTYGLCGATDKNSFRVVITAQDGNE